MNMMMVWLSQLGRFLAQCCYGLGLWLAGRQSGKDATHAKVYQARARRLEAAVRRAKSARARLLVDPAYADQLRQRFTRRG